MNVFEPIKQAGTGAVEFLSECWSELKKVHWPNRKETQAATIVVIVGVLIVAAYLGLVDIALAKTVERIFK